MAQIYGVGVITSRFVSDEGRVAALVRTGAHEVLDVRDAAGSQRLLPFVSAVIKEVDLAARRIRVEWGSDW